MCILVEMFHQSMNDAWNMTFVEFLLLIQWKDTDVKGKSTKMDTSKISELEEHLKEMGVL